MRSANVHRAKACNVRRPPAVAAHQRCEVETTVESLSGNKGQVALSSGNPGAVTVQYTWTNLGAPAGDQLAGGTLANGAASPTALSANPSSSYTTKSYGANTPLVGRSYQLRVDFYNAAGANVSSSTCTMTVEFEGANA